MRVPVTSDGEEASPHVSMLTTVGDTVCIKIEGVDEAANKIEKYLVDLDKKMARSIADYIKVPSPASKLTDIGEPTPKKNANTIDELVSIRELNRMYGLALSACNTDTIKEELDRSYKWLMRAIISAPQSI